MRVKLILGRILVSACGTDFKLAGCFVAFAGVAHAEGETCARELHARCSVEIAQFLAFLNGALRFAGVRQTYRIALEVTSLLYQRRVLPVVLKPSEVSHRISIPCGSCGSASRP